MNGNDKSSSNISNIADAGVELSGMSGSDAQGLEIVPERSQNTNSNWLLESLNDDNIFQIRQHGASLGGGKNNQGTAIKRNIVTMVTEFDLGHYDFDDDHDSDIEIATTDTNIAIATTTSQNNLNSNQNIANDDQSEKGSTKRSRIVKKKKKKSKNSSNVVKSQINEFEIELSKRETIIYHILLKLDKLDYLTSNENNIFNFQHLSKWILILSIINLFFILFDVTINYNFLHSLIFSIFRSFFLIISIFYMASSVNYNVFIRATHTFVVWYKIFNAFVGAFSRQVFLNWEIDRDIFSTTIGSNNNNNSYYRSDGVYYFRGIIQCISLCCFVFFISLIDGLPTRNKVLRRTPIFAGIIYCGIIFISVYFSLNEAAEPEKTLDIKLFGETRRFFWRSMSLSAWSNVIFFLFAQLWNNFRKYDKINAIPLDVTILRDNFQFSRFRANTKDVKRNNNNNNHNNSNKSSSKQNKSSKKHKVLNLISSNPSKNNTSTSQDYHDTDHDIIVTDIVTKSQNSLEIPSTKNVAGNINISLDEMDQKEQKVLRVPDTPSVNSINHATKIQAVDAIIDKSRTITQSQGSFEVYLPFEVTLSYVIFKRLCKFDKELALHESQVLMRKEVIWSVLISLVLVFFIYQFSFYYGIGMRIFLQILPVIGLLIVTGNVNYGLIYFKKKSLTVIYKLSSIVLMYGASLRIDYKYRRDSFDLTANGNSDIPDGLAVFIAFLICLNLFLVGLITSFLQGYFVGKYWKLSCVLAIICITANDSIPAYFDTDKDVVYNLFGQTISLRNIVITKGFDIVVWFGYQFYQIYKHPRKIKVVGKIRATWVD